MLCFRHVTSEAMCALFGILNVHECEDLFRIQFMLQNHRTLLPILTDLCICDGTETRHLYPNNHQTHRIGTNMIYKFHPHM